jgi:hypothetical protein
MKLALGTTMAAPALIKASVPTEPLNNTSNDISWDYESHSDADNLEHRLKNGETIEGEEFTLYRLIDWDVDAPYLVINCKITFCCSGIDGTYQYIPHGNIPRVHTRRIMYCDFEINHAIVDFSHYRNTYIQSNIEVVDG